MVVQLKQGCCGSLKSSTCVIGVLGIIAGIFMISSSLKNYDPSTDTTTFELIYTDPPKTIEIPIAEQTFGRIMTVVLALVEITISSVLLAGVAKDSPRLVYPWIVGNVVLTALVTILLLTLALYIAIIVQVQAGFYLFMGMTGVALTLGYTILVVNSYHTSIRTQYWRLSIFSIQEGGGSNTSATSGKSDSKQHDSQGEKLPHQHSVPTDIQPHHKEEPHHVGLGVAVVSP